MFRIDRLPHLTIACAIGLAALTSCSDPFGSNSTPNVTPTIEDCGASMDWLPNTPDLPMAKPLPHPTTECPFYRGGWQTFLQALQPDPAHMDPTGAVLPAIVSYPTIDTTFIHSTPLSPNRSYLGDIKQAGGRQILVDQNSNTLYYGIHVNQAYADFVKNNDLQTLAKVLSASTDKPKLFYPPGVAVFKSAWQVIEPQDEAASDTFVTMTTTVPTISVGTDSGGNPAILEDRDNPRTVRVRLLAIHVVFTLPGHPEFVWASFEHTNAGINDKDTGAKDGHRDVAPIFPGDVNPDLIKDPSRHNDTTIIDPTNDSILYRHGTAANASNNPAPSESVLAAAFDPATQKFVGQETSIYRLYPASKSNTPDADDAITSLNSNIQLVFRAHVMANDLLPSDKRMHYRLLGAQWMDKPAFFGFDKTLQNDGTNPLLGDPNMDTYTLATTGDAQDGERTDVLNAKGKSTETIPCPGGTQCQVSSAGYADLVANGSDSPFSMLAGEDRMSSTAMESFSQPAGSFPNCFSCHNTQSVSPKGVHDPASKVIMPAGLLNVSHIMGQFVLDECSGASPPAACP